MLGVDKCETWRGVIDLSIQATQLYILEDDLKKRLLHEFYDTFFAWYKGVHVTIVELKRKHFLIIYGCNCRRVCKIICEVLNDKTQNST